MLGKNSPPRGRPTEILGSPNRKSSVFQRSSSPTHFNANNNAPINTYITQEELQIAFQLLDSEKSGNLTLSGLKKRLGPLFPDMTAKEYRFLMNNKKEMSFNDLKSLLNDVIAPSTSGPAGQPTIPGSTSTPGPATTTHTPVTGSAHAYDPILEAFRAFDPLNTGRISDARLREAFLSFGFGELADEELDVIQKSIDFDGDGIVSLEDFRQISDANLSIANIPLNSAFTHGASNTQKKK